MGTKKERKRATQSDWRAKYRPNPIDLAILEQLPKQGMRLGLHQIGKTAPVIVEQINEKYGAGSISINNVTGRLVALCHKIHGYAASVQLVPASQGLGYQITPKGEEMLAENKHLLEEVVRG